MKTMWVPVIKFSEKLCRPTTLVPSKLFKLFVIVLSTAVLGVVFFAIYIRYSFDREKAIDTKKDVPAFGMVNVFPELAVDGLWPLLSRTNMELTTQETSLKESDLQHGRNLKIILYWNSWNPTMGNQVLVDGLCPETACIFTPDQSLLNHSHVVLFFVDEKKMFANALPAYRQPHQRFVFVTHRAAIYSHNLLSKVSHIRFDFFNWTMTYRQDSDVVLRQSMGNVVAMPTKFGHLVLSNRQKRTSRIVSSHQWMERPSNKARKVSRLGSKNKLVAWFPSNCFTQIRREEYVRQLGRYIQIDVYGKCGNLSCGLNCFETNLKSLLTEYKFYLAFEEFWCPDYISAEFYQVLDYDTVPVVLGGADYESFGPPNSFINVLDFPSAEALAQYLLFLDKNQEFYSKYFYWKQDYKVIQHPMSGWCDLCRKAHDKSLPRQTYHDIKHWVDKGKCENDSAVLSI